jgi:hypothetical protein
MGDRVKVNALNRVHVEARALQQRSAELRRESQELLARLEKILGRNRSADASRSTRSGVGEHTQREREAE